MLDEPYRWIEAIDDRREYIEDQLRGGSPVVGVQYNDGMLLLTVGSGQRKIFEVHDRIALAAIGPVADIERLRMMATDTASIQGFQNSVDDVTLHRLTNFVLGPTIKQAFESIFSSAYIIKMLLAELGSRGRENQFISLNYDGNVKSDRRALAIGGTDASENAMRDFLAAANLSNLSLADALRLSLETWAVGRESVRREAEAESRHSREREEEPGGYIADRAKLRRILAEALKEGTVEAGILQTSRRSNNKFRLATPEEIHVVIVDWI
jgi:proteasome alpha subunit